MQRERNRRLPRFWLLPRGLCALAAANVLMGVIALVLLVLALWDAVLSTPQSPGGDGIAWRVRDVVSAGLFLIAPVTTLLSGLLLLRHPPGVWQVVVKLQSLAAIGWWILVMSTLIATWADPEDGRIAFERLLFTVLLLSAALTSSWGFTYLRRQRIRALLDAQP